MQLVLVTPRATEKSYRLITSQNTYTFDVPLSANKQQIAAAVEAQYDGSEVASVTTAVQRGKAIRYSRGKRRYPGTTHRRDSKKAYVRLSEGEIKVFETEEQQPQTEQKEDK